MWFRKAKAWHSMHTESSFKYSVQQHITEDKSVVHWRLTTWRFRACGYRFLSITLRSPAWEHSNLIIGIQMLYYNYMTQCVILQMSQQMYESYGVYTGNEISSPWFWALKQVKMLDFMVHIVDLLLESLHKFLIRLTMLFPHSQLCFQIPDAPLLGGGVKTRRWRWSRRRKCPNGLGWLRRWLPILLISGYFSHFLHFFPSGIWIISETMLWNPNKQRSTYR